MSDKFTIDVQVIFLDSCAQGWDVDRYVDESKEG